ncbi:MAG: hypothetical protein JWM39_542 [Parcubacteria group bacterium]|nr:hypothetical protein [Parcubacteria group bacterium]
MSELGTTTEAFQLLCLEAENFEMMGGAIVSDLPFMINASGEPLRQPNTRMTFISLKAVPGGHLLSLELARIKEKINKGDYTAEQLKFFEKASNFLLLAVGLIKGTLMALGEEAADTDPDALDQVNVRLADLNAERKAKLN